MTTLLELPDDLMTAVARRAARDGRDLAAAVADLLRKGLAAPEPIEVRMAGRITTDPTTGLPVVECRPGAPIESMTIDEILAMEYDTLLEDDLERYGIVDEPTGLSRAAVFC